MIVENAQDMHGESAVAAADIRQYYDHVGVQNCVDELGITSTALSRAVFRHQLANRVLVRSGASTARLGVRTGGTLTGSRTAVALGRVPTAEAVTRAEKALSQNAFRVGNKDRLSLCVYIENIIAVASRATKDIASLAVIETALKDKWSLDYKPGSREIPLPTPTRQEVTDTDFKLSSAPVSRPCRFCQQIAHPRLAVVPKPNVAGRLADVRPQGNGEARHAQQGPRFEPKCASHF